MSNWIEVLKQQCEETSQRKVAADLRQADGFPSHATINQALGAKYPDDNQALLRLQGLVEGRYTCGSEEVGAVIASSGDDEEWIEVLRAECAKSTQTKVAAHLRYRGSFPSPTVINQVLSGKYPSQKGRDHLGDLVKGKYMGVTVDCPMLNEIGLDRCAWWQVQPRMSINPLRTDMYRECRKCPNRREDQ